ncbi:hypothetical protein UT300003_26180 [Clostridium sardiniense]
MLIPNKNTRIKFLRLKFLKKKILSIDVMFLRVINLIKSTDGISKNNISSNANTIELLPIDLKTVISKQVLNNCNRVMIKKKVFANLIFLFIILNYYKNIINYLNN